MKNITIWLFLILTSTSCKLLSVEKSSTTNSIKSVLLIPSPTREFIFTPQDNKYIVTYPYWIDKVYLTLKLNNSSSTSQIFGENGLELQNPLDMKMGTNIFKVKVSSPGERLGVDQFYTFVVVRNPWVSVSLTAPFQARDGAGGVVFKDKIWMLGGWLGNGENGRPSGTVSEIWYSEDGEKWEFGGNAPWPSRHSFTPVVHDNKIWVISGEGHDDVWNSDDGLNWHLVTDKAPWGHRYSPFIFAFNNRLWLMGGISWWDDEGNYTYPRVPTVSYNDVWSSVDGLHWEKLVDHAPWKSRGIVHGSIVYQGKMWVIGGGVKGSDIDSAYNDVWSTTDGIHWHLVTAAAGWDPRLHFSTVVHDNMIWLTDGSVYPKQSNLNNEVWTSTNGKDWNRLYGTPWLERHASTLISFKGKLIITCGAVPGNVINDIWKIEK